MMHLKRSVGEVCVAAAVGDMDLVFCDTQPLHQRIRPLLCACAKHPIQQAAAGTSQLCCMSASPRVCSTVGKATTCSRCAVH